MSDTPLKTDPSEIVPLNVAGYDALPKAARPTFLFAFPSTRQQKAVWRLEDQAEKAREADDEYGWADGWTEAVRLILRGWRNVTETVFAPDGTVSDVRPMPYDPQRIDELLKPGEMRELVHRWYAATRLTPEEKKASPSSPGRESGSVGGAVGASASTAPASPTA